MIRMLVEIINSSPEPALSQPYVQINDRQNGRIF